MEMPLAFVDDPILIIIYSLFLNNHTDDASKRKSSTASVSKLTRTAMPLSMNLGMHRRRQSVVVVDVESVDVVVADVDEVCTDTSLVANRVALPQK